jgi:hypothetical protein
VFSLVAAFPAEHCLLTLATAQERRGAISGVVTDTGHGVLKGLRDTDIRSTQEARNASFWGTLSDEVYGLNLTNEVFGFYQGSTIHPIQREYYNRTIGAGLRWNSSVER